MKTLKLIGMLPLVLVSATAFSQGDNRAVPRGGGSSGQSGSGHHAGPPSGGGGSNQGSHGGSAPSGGGGQYYPDAAGRRPRPGTGTGTRDRYGNEYRHYGYGGYYGGYYGYPYSYYYSPYYYWGYPGYGWGFGLGYGYGYGAYGYGYGDYYGYYPPAPSYGGYSYRDGGPAQIRTLVEPAKARVYVDGYYAGVADDFDGMFQRLNVAPGRHQITFKLEGYTSHTFSVYANVGETLKLRADLVKGTGETKETVGDDYERRPEPGLEADREGRASEPAQVRPEPGREVDSEPNERPQIQVQPQAPQPGRGEILFEILPLDASVYIDGEFHGKASQVTRVQLPFGRHRVEVVRPGYLTEETEVTVDAAGRKVVVRLDRR
jgi:hypothetical protein